MANLAAVDLEGLIERQKLGGFLLKTLAIGVAVQLIEGFDLVAAGLAGPALGNALHIERSSLGFIFSAFFVGLVLGALLFGMLGDWLGRKPVTVLSVLWFGIFSLATVTADSLPTLVAFRFLTGLGIGGVLPTTVALMCEYAPSRMRGTVLNVMICGINIGGAIGGFSAAKLIPVYGWQFVFYVGGILPILLVPCFMLWMPESIRFLVLRDRPKERILAILRRIDPRLAVDAGTRFALRDARLAGMPVRHLFAKGWAVATILLWVTMFMNQVMISFFTQYMPTMLNAFGLEMASAVAASGVFQLGAVLGTLLIGPLVDRLGYFRVLAVLYVGAGIFSILTVSFGVVLAPILIFSFAGGICVSGGQNTANALSGAFYPTLVRSTGSGWGLGIGRLGGVTGPVLAGMMLAMQWPIMLIFYALGIPAVCAAISVLLMNREAKRSPEMSSLRALEAAGPIVTGAVG